MAVAALDRLPIKLFRHIRAGPEETVLDPDHASIPLHGLQEERFFQGFFRVYIQPRYACGSYR